MPIRAEDGDTMIFTTGATVTVVESQGIVLTVRLFRYDDY